MSDNIHHSGGTICEPVDLPVNKRHFDMVYSHIKYSDKAFMDLLLQLRELRTLLIWLKYYLVMILLIKIVYL